MLVFLMYIFWSIVGGIVWAFVDSTTGFDDAAWVVAGLTGLVGGWTTAHLMRQQDRRAP